MSSPTAAQQVVEQYLDAYNEREIEQIRAVLADSIESEGTTIARDDLVEAIEAYWAAFPDCKHSQYRFVSADDHVAVRTIFSGTHVNEYYGLPPTGEEFEVTEFMMFRVNNRVIDAYWYAWDELGFWAQLGVLDHPLK